MLKYTLIALGLAALIVATPSDAFAKRRGKLPSRGGYASWYNHMNYRKITASRDWPCGSRIRVTNVKTGKSVIVVVKDWGPAKWTGRNLDLNRPAFEKIAPLSQGEAKIRYQVLSIGRCKIHQH